MFDFERLAVYQKAKSYNKEVRNFVSKQQLDRNIKDQLQRASLSVMLNIAEGAGRFTNKDKRHFYVIARGSVYECVALFDFLKDEELVDDVFYKIIYSTLEELSKMLYALIRGLE